MSTATAQPMIGPQLPVVTVAPYKRRTASTKLNWRRNPLEQVEYAPDNSRIGRESAGMQTRPDTDNQGTYQQVKAATLRRLLTEGPGYSLNCFSGIFSPRAVTVEGPRMEYSAQPVSKPIGCETRPATLGNTRTAYQFKTEYILNPKPMKYQPHSESTAKGKAGWQPQISKPIRERYK